MVSKNNDDNRSEDVIIEILSRLPVKSLMRLKCVCKYWSTLIRNSSFISRHFHHHSNIAHLCVQHYDYSTEKYTFALFPNETVTNSSVEYHNLGDFQMPTQPGILGIFHGIIGLHDTNRIALWNPAIKEFKVLHVPEPDVPEYSYIFHHFSGFGLDPITNNYKVVRIWEYGEHSEELEFVRIAAVYNLYADSWRLFEVDLGPLNRVHQSLSNTYMNGFYYWMTSYDDILILAFDMDKEIMGHIPGPPLPNYNYGEIVLHNNSIALLHWDREDDEKFFDIWVMEEERFWTKELTIGPLLGIRTPLGFWKNGEVFLETDNSELVLYNCNTHEMKDFQIHGNKDAFQNSIWTFIYRRA
ncbi:F-box protein At4g19940-like [Cornus florida]|uniref:F-box protein At4g19940-like n=1 Tax=Cornus florida TaxID=4283 RepID=UPI002899E116|nr:F-box protein At4g19940-like [Cornus florida]